MQTMKLVQRTLEKIVFSVTSKEIDAKGFDAIWDDIRENYCARGEFDVLSISADKKDNDIYFIELAPK